MKHWFDDVDAEIVETAFVMLACAAMLVLAVWGLVEVIGGQWL